MVKAEVIRLLGTANHEAAKGKMTPLYQAVETVLRRVVARGAVNEIMEMNLNNLAESQDFV